MANGSEVTKKVKDAIKAKLVELGAYVDDELPDYIMVLVANKKNKDQMDEDLSLFLGHNTEKFTSWLHGVLQKLNAASFFKAPLLTEISTDTKNEAALMKERLELKKEKSEKKKEKKMRKKKKSKDKKDKVSKKMSKNQEKTLNGSEVVPKDIADVTTTTNKLQDKLKNIITFSNDPENIEADILDIEPDPQELTLESDEELVTNQPPPPIQRTIHQNVDPIPECETNMNKEIQSDKKTSIRDRLGPFNSEKKAITFKEETNLPLKSTIEKKTGMGRVLSSSIASAVRSVTQTDRSGRVQTKLEARVKPLMSERMKRHASSDDDDDIQPKKSLKLTSVVRPVVSQPQSTGVASKVEVIPRPRRAGSGQANTALILRAVADAHKSVNRPSKRPVEEDVEEPHAAKRKQLFTKAFQSQMKDSDQPKVRKIAITVPNVHAEVSPHNENNSSDEQILPEDFDGQPEELVEYEYKEKVIPKVASDQTRFIITMDGMQEKNIKERLGSRRNSSLDDDYIEEIEEWEEEEEGSTVAEPTQAAQPVKKINVPVVAPKKEDKCKFWPDCKEGEACRFNHPNKTCIMFPNCKFGTKCIYVHPQCKFDSTCTKLNCQFSHSAKPAVSSLGVAVSKIKCKFFPKCTDMNCPYMHPKQICRFGSFCKSLHCTYIHPEVTYGPKLKWTAPKPVDQIKSEETIKS